jgi:hypothetical protein
LLTPCGDAFLVAAMHHGIERRCEQALLHHPLQRELLDLRRVVDHMLGATADELVRRGLDGERLRRRQLFTRHLRCRHGPPTVTSMAIGAVGVS